MKKINSSDIVTENTLHELLLMMDARLKHIESELSVSDTKIHKYFEDEEKIEKNNQRKFCNL